MSNTVRVRNVAARALREGEFRHRVERAAKGRGAYTRKGRRDRDDD